jgi:hypothetical protein
MVAPKFRSSPKIKPTTKEEYKINDKDIVYL